MIALNRAIAAGEVHGPQAALDLVDQFDLPEYPAFHAIRADLLRRLGRTDHAATAYDTAASLTPSPAERGLTNTAGGSRPGPAGSGATFLPPPHSEPRQEPRRYHDEPITITIVVDRPAELIGAVDQLRGPIRFVRAGEVDKVVIGVGNDIDCEFTYVVKEMDVDLGEFWHDLSVEARAVLAELVAEPANKEAIHRFQELLVASRQRDPHLVTELPAAGRVELDVGTCRVCVVVDDHRHIPVRRRPVIASTTLPLADVLKSNDRLVRLFAEAVADRDAGRRFAKNARAVQNKEPTAQFLGRCRPGQN